MDIFLQTVYLKNVFRHFKRVRQTMKKTLLYLIFPLCAACALHDEKPFYEKDYVLAGDAVEWAKTAPLKDLCQGTKNWRLEAIQKASLNEIKERGLDTRECYYTGMTLTP